MVSHVMHDLHDEGHTEYSDAQLRESGLNGCDICADWYDETQYDQTYDYGLYRPVGTPHDEHDHVDDTYHFPF